MSFGLESEQAVYASVCVWSLTCLLKTHKEIDQAHVWTAIVEIKQVVRLDGAHTHTLVEHDTYESHRIAI